MSSGAADPVIEGFCACKRHETVIYMQLQANTDQIQQALAVWRQPCMDQLHRIVSVDQKSFTYSVNTPPSALKVHQNTQ